MRARTHPAARKGCNASTRRLSRGCATSSLARAPRSLARLGCSQAPAAPMPARLASQIVCVVPCTLWPWVWPWHGVAVRRQRDDGGREHARLLGRDAVPGQVRQPDRSAPGSPSPPPPPPPPSAAATHRHRHRHRRTRLGALSRRHCTTPQPPPTATPRPACLRAACGVRRAACCLPACVRRAACCLPACVRVKLWSADGSNAAR